MTPGLGVSDTSVFHFKSSYLIPLTLATAAAKAPGLDYLYTGVT